MWENQLMTQFFESENHEEKMKKIFLIDLFNVFFSEKLYLLSAGNLLIKIGINWFFFF